MRPVVSARKRRAIYIFPRPRAPAILKICLLIVSFGCLTNLVRLHGRAHRNDDVATTSVSSVTTLMREGADRRPHSRKASETAGKSGGTGGAAPIVEVRPRAFPEWPPPSSPPFNSWCFNPGVSTTRLLGVTYQDGQPALKGFFYQKTPKCASTTTAGVALRIARNVAKRQQQKNARLNKELFQFCDVRVSHGIQASTVVIMCVEFYTDGPHPYLTQTAGIR